MASTLITRAGALAQTFRKAIAVTVLGISPDGSARFDATAIPTLTAGTGAPTEAANNGSLYLRTDGADGTDSIYMRIAGSWVALAG